MAYPQFEFKDEVKTAIATAVIEEFARQLNDIESAPRGTGEGEIPYPPWYQNPQAKSSGFVNASAAKKVSMGRVQFLVKAPEFKNGIRSLEGQIDVYLRQRDPAFQPERRGRGRPPKTAAVELGLELARFVEGSLGIPIAQPSEDPTRGYEASRDSLLARLLRICYRATRTPVPEDMRPHVEKILSRLMPSLGDLPVTENERRYAERHDERLDDAVTRIYCDVCRIASLDVPGAGRKEVNKQLRAQGWEHTKKGTHICPDCLATA